MRSLSVWTVPDLRLLRVFGARFGRLLGDQIAITPDGTIDAIASKAIGARSGLAAPVKLLDREDFTALNRVDG